MTDIPQNLRYAQSHEWARLEEDGSVTVGITDHAQSLLGDLVFVEAPEMGSVLQSGVACATVESVKAASDIYAPVSGTVEAVNLDLRDHPEQVNESPYAAGWLFRLRPSAPADLEGLLDATAYAAVVADDGG